MVFTRYNFKNITHLKKTKGPLSYSLIYPGPHKEPHVLEKENFSKWQNSEVMSNGTIYTCSQQTILTSSSLLYLHFQKEGHHFPSKMFRNDPHLSKIFFFSFPLNGIFESMYNSQSGFFSKESLNVLGAFLLVFEKLKNQALSVFWVRIYWFEQF